MAELHVDTPRGLMDPTAGKEAFRLARYLPSPGPTFFVEQYWGVAWDRRGREPSLSETLPHPCVNVVVEDGHSGVFGVPRSRFSRVLAGAGRFFGVKFRPGAFDPFWGSPVSELTNRGVGLHESFGREGEDLRQAILRLDDDGASVEVAEQFLRDQRPDRDPNVAAVAAIVDAIGTDRGILRVEDVASRSSGSTRTFQRRFDRYVGVSPTWVIRYYRLHEAAERLASSEPVGLSELAHFANDFRAVIGVAPATYARRVHSHVVQPEVG